MARAYLYSNQAEHRTILSNHSPAELDLGDSWGITNIIQVRALTHGEKLVISDEFGRSSAEAYVATRAGLASQKGRDPVEACNVALAYNAAIDNSRDPVVCGRARQRLAWLAPNDGHLARHAPVPTSTRVSAFAAVKIEGCFYEVTPTRDGSHSLEPFVDMSAFIVA